MPHPSPHSHPPAFGHGEALPLAHLRKSPVLRACAAVAFVEYGALAMIATFGGRLDPRVWAPETRATMALWLALCSVGSWSFLFLWFPALARLGGPGALGRDERRGSPYEGAALPPRVLGVLEAVAVGCVLFVHAMLAAILVLALV